MRCAVVVVLVRNAKRVRVGPGGWAFLLMESIVLYDLNMYQRDEADYLESYVRDSVLEYEKNDMIFEKEIFCC